MMIRKKVIAAVGAGVLTLGGGSIGAAQILTGPSAAATNQCSNTTGSVYGSPGGQGGSVGGTFIGGVGGAGTPGGAGAPGNTAPLIGAPGGAGGAGSLGLGLSRNKKNSQRCSANTGIRLNLKG